MILILEAGMKEERHVDGNQQAFPLAIGHFKVGECIAISETRLYLDLSMPSKSNGAGVACAENLPGGELNEVRMVMPRPALHSSQNSTAREAELRDRVNWRRTPNACSKPRVDCSGTGSPFACAGNGRSVAGDDEIVSQQTLQGDKAGSSMVLRGREFQVRRHPARIRR